MNRENGEPAEIGPMMRLYDTAAQSVVDFSAGNTVKMYICGITPYDSAHVGHAAVYFTFDVLRRRLHDLGVTTECVRNVTDVDDDILRKSRELGVHFLDLAAEEMVRFDTDMRALGLMLPTSEPRATSAIPDILGFIGMVLDAGYAYVSNGGVYFRVGSFPRFGQVSHLGREEMLALAAQRGGNVDDPNKEDPLDFVLWQPSAPDEPAWESLWGPGRPGWHIECSALALRELGTTVDIHGGGSDLIFPHHECEAAQSEAATSTKFVRHWMHVGMVGYEGEKMSKSLGNLVFVSDLLKDWSPDSIRVAIGSHHYRHPWEFLIDEMAAADARVSKWQASGEGEAGLKEVRQCLDNDLDIPAAYRVLDAATEDANRSGGVSEAMRLLGLSSH